MKKILVIEDNAEILDNINDILRLANYKVSTAKNGREGIDMAWQVEPDMVLCDILMPEANGYEVLQTLKKSDKTRNIPFVFVTASVELKDVNIALDMGANGYLKKPFNAEELLSMISSLITD